MFKGTSRNVVQTKILPIWIFHQKILSIIPRHAQFNDSHEDSPTEIHLQTNLISKFSRLVQLHAQQCMSLIVLGMDARHIPTKHKQLANDVQETVKRLQNTSEKLRRVLENAVCTTLTFKTKDGSKSFDKSADCKQKKQLTQVSSHRCHLTVLQQSISQSCLHCFSVLLQTQLLFDSPSAASSLHVHLQHKQTMKQSKCIIW